MSYDPDEGAVPASPWNTALLSQRDLTFRVPINFVTEPAISLTAACFSHGRYERAATNRCFSNLLAVGFRRFSIDLYWDAGRQIWSLCPAQVPGDENNSDATPEPSSGSSTLASLSRSLLLAGKERRQAATLVSSSSRRFPDIISAVGFTSQPPSIITPSSETTSSLLARISTVSGNASNITSPTLTVPSQAQPTLTVTPANETLYTIGPYRCSPSVNLQAIVEVLLDYIHSTEDTVQGHLEYLILNLHVASSINAPTEPSQQPLPSELPTSESLLSAILKGNISSYLYTPSKLVAERWNLNATWNEVPVESTADPAYSFHELSASNGTLTSPNGWPTEVYTLFGERNRVLIGFGQVDPQLASYNSGEDSAVIFVPGQLQSYSNVRVNASGFVTDGCIFDPGTTSIPILNASWAVSDEIIGLDSMSTSDGDGGPAVNSVRSLITCGVSPLVNQSVLNTTADSNYQPYQRIAYHSIWSWASGEPRNSSLVSEDPSSKAPVASHQSHNFRCAVLDTSLQGRWRVADCFHRYYAACRSVSSPFEWTISAERTTLVSASDGVCPANTTFAVPHTALENTYLYSAIGTQRPDLLYSTPPSVSNDTYVWLNFNSMDVDGCWVVGVNQTCPYTPNDNYRRTVVIPTVAAIIICVVTGFFLFVKFASHRRDKGRRRKRKNKGWDYEGVPG